MVFDLTSSNMVLNSREVHGHDKKSFYARVLYSGHPVRSIHGVLDWVPLSDLIDNLSPYVPTDITALCG
jgi:hypothetical protein